MQEGLTQEEVAARAGIRQSALSKVERGDTDSPGILYLSKITRALDRSLDELVAELQDAAEVACLQPALVAA